MPRLFGNGATITPQTTGDVPVYRILWGFNPSQMQFAFQGDDFVHELVNGLQVDVPRSVFFAVTTSLEVDGVTYESEPSNAIEKIMTLRETVITPDPPPPPVLEDVAVDIPVQDDMPNREYEIEVTSP